ncbi:bacterioferritin [Martelella radicis]|uniref:Bacterioferritin n=1 Tax=Martelella radicis TaxID=1397476 RepID=A0A7W6PAA7_9HYPH|nr:bacterioferritin [Martelella radicis]MBB4122650.1 bacterioferritin [Martelella radicis]
MKNTKLIEYLQRAVNMEMSAAHQYQLHAHTLEDWGLTKMAAKMREEMSEELGHSDLFIERLFFLKASPRIAFDKEPHKAESLPDMFKSDKADEEEAISVYTEAAKHAAELGDIGTRTLFEKIVLDEEGHKAWLELQLDLIERLGEKTYSAKLVSFDEDEEAED